MPFPRHDKIGVQLESMLAGDSLKYDPVIQRVAGSLSLQFIGIELDEETAIQAATTMADQLAELKKTLKLSIDDIQNALMAADPRLAEVQEGYFHTY